MRKNQSITRRFFFYLVVIIVLSNLLIFGASYLIAQKNMHQQSSNMAANLMESHLLMMEDYFRDIDQVAESLIYNPDIIRFLKEKKSNTEDLKFLYGIGSVYYTSRPDLELIFYKKRLCNNQFSIVQKDRADTIPDYRNSGWYQSIEQQKKDRMIFVKSQDEEGQELTPFIIYRVRDRYYDDTVGYLRVNMNLQSLKERLLHSYKELDGTTIWDEKGRALFYDKLIIEVPEQEQNSGTIHMFETKKYLISWGISQRTGWKITMAVSKEGIIQKQRQMAMMLLLLLAGIIMASLFFSKKCFSIITVNFQRLVEGMERVKKGELTTQVEVETQDEISILIQEFNSMIKKVDLLVQTVESKQLLLKEAEVKALQQQINPHFIHNIMETIMGLASEGMKDQVITVSKCLSSMLRYNMRLENITTLETELKQVYNYIQILKIRFEDRFTVDYEIDEACLTCGIVKFTLQPLVENAITHGFRDTDTGGILRLDIKRKGDCVRIRIADNGCGISKNLLLEMNKRFEQTTDHPLDYIDQYKSLGLLNVYLRLRLRYGSSCVMKIFSKENKGTCISMWIPYEPEKRKRIGNEKDHDCG